jgi:amino acid transporter
MTARSPKMGLWMLTALVAGNMIGSGIFLLPANLATLGTISLWGWAITMTGAMLLAYIFARFSVLIPRAGGPYIYTKKMP